MSSPDNLNFEALLRAVQMRIYDRVRTRVIKAIKIGVRIVNRKYDAQYADRKLSTDPIPIFKHAIEKSKCRKCGKRCSKKIPEHVVLKTWEFAKRLAANEKCREEWNSPLSPPDMDQLIAKVLNAIGKPAAPGVVLAEIQKAQEEHVRKLCAQMPATPPSLE